MNKFAPPKSSLVIVGLSFVIVILAYVSFLFYPKNTTQPQIINETEEQSAVLGISGAAYQCTHGVNCPSDVLNLTNWKITLPIGSAESPIEVKPTDQPPLIPIKDFKHDEYFHLTSDKTGVVFKAHAGGTTTSGSGYPRSELRERKNNGQEDANWSSSSGKHAMYIDQAVLHLPVEKPHVVIGQIHAQRSGSTSNDDIVVFRLEGKKLYINADGTTNDVVLTDNYILGTRFNVGFEVENSKIKFYYNGQLVSHTMSVAFTNAYFKAGMYTQSNCFDNKEFPEDSCDAYGEAVIYNLVVCENNSNICGPAVTTTPTNQAPKPVITATPTLGTAPLIVNFSSAGSTDPDGTIVSYKWEFGNGSTSTSANPVYTYSASGSYTVKLTATDDKGATGVVTKAITVSTATTTTTNKPPLPVISANPASGVTPLAVAFSAAGSTDSDGRIVSYQWDLDDNANPTGVSVTHTYKTAKSYRIKLTVKDDKGASASTYKTITVTAPTTSTINSVIGAYTGANNPFKYTFDGGSSTSTAGTISSYQWYFEPGTGTVASTSKKFSHTFSAAGTYTIRLTVKDSTGASSTTSMSIIVSAN